MLQCAKGQLWSSTQHIPKPKTWFFFFFFLTAETRTLLHWQNSTSCFYFGLKGANGQRNFGDKYIRLVCIHFITEQRAGDWFSIRSADGRNEVQFLRLRRVPQGVSHIPLTMAGSRCRMSHLFRACQSFDKEQFFKEGWSRTWRIGSLFYSAVMIDNPMLSELTLAQELLLPSEVRWTLSNPHQNPPLKQYWKFSV